MRLTSIWSFSMGFFVMLAPLANFFPKILDASASFTPKVSRPAIHVCSVVRRIIASTHDVHAESNCQDVLAKNTGLQVTFKRSVGPAERCNWTVPKMVVTHFFLLLVFVSSTTSFLAFFLTFPPGSCFSMTSPCLSFKVRSATALAAPPSCAAFHLCTYRSSHARPRLTLEQ